MKLSSFFCSVVFLLAQIACGVAQTDSTSSNAPASSDAATADTQSQTTGTSIATSPNYILSPNDLLDIRVFQEDDLHTIVRIPQDGVINFPLIGSVKIGGRSVAQATELIRSLLQKDYLVNPQVNLTITEYAKRHFTIIGQVQRPGTYNIPDEQQIDLLDAIAMAGGFTRIANQHNVTLKRLVDGKEKIFKLNPARMAKENNTAIFKIQEDDTIVVYESIF